MHGFEHTFSQRVQIARIAVYLFGAIAYIAGGFYLGRTTSSRSRTKEVKKLQSKLEDQTERATFFESEIDRLSALIPERGKGGKFVRKGENNGN